VYPRRESAACESLEITTLIFDPEKKFRDLSLVHGFKEAMQFLT